LFDSIEVLWYIYKKTINSGGIMLNWDTTEKELRLIHQIVQRAKKEIEGVAPMKTSMDIEACCCNDIRLDLEKLLAFPGDDFRHDIKGITGNINRASGRLENGFVPRCSINEKSVVEKDN